MMDMSLLFTLLKRYKLSKIRIKNYTKWLFYYGRRELNAFAYGIKTMSQWVLSLGVLLICSALIIRYYILPDLNIIEPYINKIFSQTFKQPVRIKGLTAQWHWSSASINIVQLEIGQHHSPPIVAKHIYTRIPLYPLIWQHISTQALHIGEINLDFKQVGRFNKPQWFLAGFNLKPSNDGHVLKWLLKQPIITVARLKITVQDEATHWIPEGKAQFLLEHLSLSNQLLNPFNQLNPLNQLKTNTDTVNNTQIINTARTVLNKIQKNHIDKPYLPVLDQQNFEHTFQVQMNPKSEDIRLGKGFKILAQFNHGWFADIDNIHLWQGKIHLELPRLKLKSSTNWLLNQLIAVYSTNQPQIHPFVSNLNVWKKWWYAYSSFNSTTLALNTHIQFSPKQLMAHTNIVLNQLPNTLNKTLPLNFVWQWNQSKKQSESTHQIKADMPALSIASWLYEAQTMPLPNNILQRLNSAKPQGLLKQIKLNLMFDTKKIHIFNISTSVDQAAIHAFNWQSKEKNISIPNIDGVSGQLNINYSYQKPNQMFIDCQLNSHNTRVLLPTLIAKPTVLFNAIQGDIGLVFTKKSVNIALKRIQFNHADAQGLLNGTYHYDFIPTQFKLNSALINEKSNQTPHDSLGILNVQGQFTRLDLSKIYHYLPLSIPTSTRNWLKNTLIKGTMSPVNWSVNGELSRFPFASNSPIQNNIPNSIKPIIKSIEHFTLSGIVNGGVLNFNPVSAYSTPFNWPIIESVSGHIAINGHSMVLSQMNGYLNMNHLDNKFSYLMINRYLKPDYFNQNNLMNGHSINPIPFNTRDLFNIPSNMDSIYLFDYLQTFNPKSNLLNPPPINPIYGRVYSSYNIHTIKPQDNDIQNNYLQDNPLFIQNNILFNQTNKYIKHIEPIQVSHTPHTKQSMFKIELPRLIMNNLNEPIIMADINAKTQTDYVLNIIRNTPLSTYLGKQFNVLNTLNTQGNAEIYTRLNLDINKPYTTTVQGKAILNAVDISLSKALPPIENINAVIAFKDNSFFINTARANWLGGSVTLSGGLNTPGIQNTLNLQGRAYLNNIKQYSTNPMAQALLQHAKGALNYDLQLSTDPIEQGMRWTVKADLTDTQLQWTGFLNKPIGMALPFSLSRTPIQFKHASAVPNSNPIKQDRWEVSLGATVLGPFQGVIERQLEQNNWLIKRGAVALGNDSILNMPDSGLGVHIKGQSVNFDHIQTELSALPWQSIAIDETNNTTIDTVNHENKLEDKVNLSIKRIPPPAWMPTTIAVQVENLIFGNRLYKNIVCGASRSGVYGENWNGNLVAHGINGYFSWKNFNFANNLGGGQLELKLTELTIPTSDLNNNQPSLFNIVPNQIPSIQLNIDKLTLGTQYLGRVSLDADQITQIIIDKHPVGMSSINQSITHTTLNKPPLETEHSWNIRSLSIQRPNFDMKANGLWQYNIHHPKGQVNLNITVITDDLGKILTDFKYDKIITAAAGELTGHLIWQGAPWTMDMANVSGTINAYFKKGRFLKADPGVGRLAGLLTLQNLPRRLNLDFKDTFGEGFLFDKVNFSAKINQGQLTLDSFLMRSPLAKIMGTGEVSLSKQTQALRFIIKPEINAGSASLLYIGINPVIGLSTLAAQWLLRKPLMDSLKVMYDVTGSWIDPQINTVKDNVAMPQLLQDNTDSTDKGLDIFNTVNQSTVIPLK